MKHRRKLNDERRESKAHMHTTYIVNFLISQWKIIVLSMLAYLATPLVCAEPLAARQPDGAGEASAAGEAAVRFPAGRD